MNNNIKSIVLVSISVIALLFAVSCKKETTNQPPVITPADELTPQPGNTYIVVDSGEPIHVEFDVTDDHGLSQGMVTVYNVTTGHTIYDTMFNISGTSYSFHQHIYPTVTDTNIASITIMFTDDNTAMSMDTVLVKLLP